MIEQLAVRDLAVVEKADIAFGPGLNAITGETGAGKSVLLGAIGLLTGARADRAAVRAGAAQAEVSASFALPQATLETIAPILEEAGLEPCEEGQLLIRRTLTAAGTGRCWVNNAPATVAVLRRIGIHLVDFHGPHDNQSLLDPGFQLDSLDSFGGCARECAAYREAYRAVLALEARKKDLSGDAGSVEREIDLLRYQTSEIAEARLDPEADGEALADEYNAATNATRILELGSAATAALSDAEGNAVDAMAAAVRALEEMKGLGCAEARDWFEELRTHSEAISELSRSMASSLTRIDASPERLEELEKRMSLVETLKHKYGRTLPDVLEFLRKAEARLADLEGREEALAKIDSEIAAAEKAARAAGTKLTAKRTKAAASLAAAVCAELRDLGLARAGFRVDVAPSAELLPTGTDTVEFGFAPNPGEPMRALRAIASSGEISRVMLALKTVLAAHDRIPVLVFDEIDANVGGEIARTVGEKLAALGATRQVLCITHLPQVASCGLRHFAVRKQVKGDRTFTSIAPLEGDARVDEISRMLGGEKLTSVVREHARQLLGKKRTPSAPPSSRP